MIVWVALAGAIGAIVRLAVDSEFKRRVSATFAWGTGFINVTGSLIIGLIAGVVMYHSGAPELQTVIGTGFCGGYTTFSTASVETVELMRQERRGAALVYAGGSLIISVLACAAGLGVAQLF